MSWTDERVEKLKTLWAEGLSASQIATALGEVTRNAVIGKVHRLGLAGRAKSSSSAARTPKPAATTRRSTKAAQPASRPSAPSFASAGSAAIDTKPIVDRAPVEAIATHPLADPNREKTTILDLNEHTCRWPIGDPGQEEFHFCGQKPRASGGPYCEFHSRIAYQPVAQRGVRRTNAVAAKVG